MTKSVWVIDIDKTIADHSHREHLLVEYCCSCGQSSGLKTMALEGPKANKWRKFCPTCQSDVFHTPPSSWQRFTQPEYMANDTPVAEAQVVIRQAIRYGIDIHYISGRQELARSVTMAWLEKHFDFNSYKNKLLMRAADGYTNAAVHVPASVHKEQAFKNLKEWCGYSGDEAFYFYEDDTHARKMYSKYGIVLDAPACWKSMVPPMPTNAEALFAK